METKKQSVIPSRVVKTAFSVVTAFALTASSVPAIALADTIKINDEWGQENELRHEITYDRDSHDIRLAGGDSTLTGTVFTPKSTVTQEELNQIKQDLSQEHKDSDEVIFNDKNLKAMLLATTPHTGDKITYGDAKKVTGSLALSTCGIKSIRGLQAYTNVQNVYLNNNQISTLLPLSKLKQITYLNVSNSGLTDKSVEGLSELTNITVLECCQNYLTTLSFTDNMTKLTLLNAMGNEVTTLSATAKKPNLQLLLLGFNKIEKFPDNFIENMPALTALSVTHNNITELPKLPESIKSLDISWNYIKDFKNLRPSGYDELNTTGNNLGDTGFVGKAPWNISSSCSDLKDYAFEVEGGKKVTLPIVVKTITYADFTIQTGNNADPMKRGSLKDFYNFIDISTDSNTKTTTVELKGATLDSEGCFVYKGVTDSGKEIQGSISFDCSKSPDPYKIDTPIPFPVEPEKHKTPEVTPVPKSNDADVTPIAPVPLKPYIPAIPQEQPVQPKKTHENPAVKPEEKHENPVKPDEHKVTPEEHKQTPAKPEHKTPVEPKHKQVSPEKHENEHNVIQGGGGAVAGGGAGGGKGGMEMKPKEPQHQQATVQRLYRETALGTMQNLVKQAFLQTSDYAVISTKDGYWDSLAASSLAGKYDCPILLSNYDGLPQETIQELQRLGVKHVFVCGGTSVLSNGVVSQLEGMGIQVERIAGNMTSDTANLIADKVGHSDEAFLATSWGFTDALSASSLAFATKRPIYLADYATSSLDSATLNTMKKNGVKKVIIVGGTSVVSSDVEGILESNGIAVERIAGETCYDTSKEFLKRFQGEFDMSTVGATTSWGFTDALAAAPFFGKMNSPVLLTDDSNTTSFGDVDFSSVKKAYIVGGEKVVGTSAASKLWHAING